MSFPEAFDIPEIHAILALFRDRYGVEGVPTGAGGRGEPCWLKINVGDSRKFLKIRSKEPGFTENRPQKYGRILREAGIRIPEYFPLASGGLRSPGPPFTSLQEAIRADDISWLSNVPYKEVGQWLRSCHLALEGKIKGYSYREVRYRRPFEKLFSVNPHLEPIFDRSNAYMGQTELNTSTLIHGNMADDHILAMDGFAWVSLDHVRPGFAYQDAIDFVLGGTLFGPEDAEAFIKGYGVRGDRTFAHLFILSAMDRMLHTDMGGTAYLKDMIAWAQDHFGGR